MTATVTRKVKRYAILPQGTTEYVAYKFDFTRLVNQLGAVQAITDVELIDRSDSDRDISSTNLTGSTVLSSPDAITFSVYGLTAGHKYRLTISVQFPAIGGVDQIRSAYVDLKGE